MPLPAPPITKTTTIDLLHAATDPSYITTTLKSPGFYVYNKSFPSDILGPNPTLQLLEERDYQFAHEAGVYIKSTNRIYFTANFQTCDPVDLYSISADAGVNGKQIDVRKENYPDVIQANGACNYQDKVLYCAQGNKTTPSSLSLVDPSSTSPAENTKHMLNNFHARPFNSVNDVVIHHGTGDIWFTDPTYGYMQGFRPAPQLPNQIYRFVPSTGEISVVADGFEMCNGLCFSPDYKTLYVTDTGAIKAHGGVKDGHNMSFEPSGLATIYAYDVAGEGRTLVNRRTFAFTDSGVPDGIKCDEKGFVYSGCGDGVHVWDARGSLVGKIVVGGMVANFCFAPRGSDSGGSRMWLFAEEQLWVVELKARGALMGVECD